MCYSKREGDDTIIVVVNLDPHGTRETTVRLDMPALGLDWDDRVAVRDEITGESFRGARTTTCAWTRSTSPPTCCTSGATCDRDADVTAPAGHSAVPDPFDTRIARDPDWFKRAVFYEVLVRAFADSDGDGTGDLRGSDAAARLPRLARRRLPVAAAVLRLTAARRRLRRRALHRGAAGVRDARRLRRVRRRDARARHARDHRLRHEPHERPAPVVPGQPVATPTVRTATSTSGPTPTTPTRTRGSSSSTPRRRTGRSTPSASSTTGTGSSATSRTSTSRTPTSRTRSSRPCGSGWTSASTASGSTPCPYLFEDEGTNCENLPATHEFLKRVRKEIDRLYPDTGHARRGQPVAGGRRRLPRRPGHRRRRVPHGLPLPA